MKAVLIVGCGDVGRRVARLCSPAPVAGVVKSERAATHLQSLGIQPLRLDLDQPFSADELPAGGRETYWFAPPPSEGETDPRVAAACAAWQGNNRPAKLVYISTTAVYGDCRGAWIDETAPLRPGTARGRRRLDAERRLLQWGTEQEVPVVILRVPGIYGAGRLPVERLRMGLPVLAEADSPFTNRIQVDDLAQICVTAMRKGRAGEVYNVSDGRPGTMTEYFFRVADALGLPRPPVVDRATAEKVLSPSMLSFLSESKRLVNTKLVEELGIRLRYPSLRDGLEDAVSALPDGPGENPG